MTDIDNFGTSWQGLTHGQVEDAIKAKVAHLDSTKLEESSDVIQQLVSAVTSAYYMRPTGIPKTDLAGDVQTSLGKADTALQQADKTQLQNAINSLQNALDTLIGSGNVQGAIDTFNEVVDFLNGIDTDDPTLANQLLALNNAITALQTSLASKANSADVVPNIRTVNGKALSNNITLSQSDIPGLVAALATKVGYSDDEWLQVKAGAMQAATAVPNTTTVNGKQLNDNIVIGMADIPGLLQAIANAGSGAVSVQQNADGSFSITVGNDTYVFDDFPTKQDMADAIDDALGEAQVAVVPEGSVGVISSLGSDSDEDALSASMGKKLKVAIITILNSLGNYAFPGGKPVIDWGDDTPVTYTVSKTIGTGLSATGGDTDVEMGDSLEVTIAITDNLYIIDDNSVVVTMGGQPVAGAWNASTMKVTIGTVTGNVVIIVPSLTYVGYGEQNSPLAFMLDCKNRGNQSGHWIDLIGNIDFTLGSAVVAADTGVVFDGTTNSYGETNSVLNIAPSAGTIEAIVVGASGEYNPILINPVASGDNDNIGLCIYNYSNVLKIATMSMRYPGSNDPTINCSADTGSVTDFALSLNNQKYMNKGVGSTPGTKYSFLMNTAHTKLTLGRSRRPASDSRGDVVFVGTIKAIRIYNNVLTEAQQLQNWKVDQKRFNIS